MGKILASNETSINTSSNKNSVSPNELDYINIEMFSGDPSTRKTSGARLEIIEPPNLRTRQSS
jgi:hypothetical protein